MSRNKSGNFRNAKMNDDSSKFKGKGRNTKRTGKTWDKESDGVDNKPSPSALNDPSWYASNAQLLNDSGSLSYNNAIGGYFTLSDGGTPPYMNMGDTSVPGVLAIHTIPSVGISTDNSSPINIASRNIYSFVRHANAGHANYDSPDLMLYLMAMDSLYTMYSFMIRAYGTMRLYSIKNRYLPQALMAAMNLDFDDFQSNLADFRYFINSCAVKIGAMCAPASMSYFLRHMWMFQEVYADSTSSKSQIMMYVPYAVYKFASTADPHGGRLEPMHISCNQSGDAHPKLKFADLRAKVDELIAAVIQDEDMNIMSGDILKAFGADGVFKLAPIPEDYLIIPQYAPEVLSQMQNATLVGVPSATSFLVTQNPDTGAILFNPTFRNSCTGLKGKRILNQNLEDPTPGDNMVATRLMVIAKTETFNTTSQNEDATLDSSGSDIAVYGSVYSMSSTNKGTIQMTGMLFINGYNTQNHSELIAQISTFCDLEKFTCHPPLRLLSYDSLNATTGYVNVKWVNEFLNMDNYTVVGAYELYKMHETALLSQFNCPRMGSYNQK